MLDPKFIRENIDIVKDAITKRNMNIDLDVFIQLDADRRALLVKKEEFQAERNRVSKLIPTITDNEER